MLNAKVRQAYNSGLFGSWCRGDSQSFIFSAVIAFIASLQLIGRPESVKLHLMDSVILANEALKLSALERAQIIDALWRSLDPAEQAANDQAWVSESRDRLNAYRDGKLKALDGEESLRDLHRHPDSLRKNL